MADNLSVKDAVGANRTLRSSTNAADATPVHKPHHVSDGSRKQWRDGFTSSTLTTNWVATTGSGATVAASAGVLTLTTGATAGGYVELLSVETFSIPSRVVACVQTTTRNTNTHFFVELVSVNATTGAIDSLSAASWAFGGIISTTPTVAQYETTNGGLAPTVASAQTITSTATYSVLEIEGNPLNAKFASRATNATSRPYEYQSEIVAPDPAATYKLRVRSLNAAAFKSITGAIAGTGNVVRLTCTTHGYSTSDSVWVEYLAGATNNGTAVRGWYTITVVDANTFELQGTVFAGTYTAGSGRCAKATAPTSSVLTIKFLAVQDHTVIPTELAYSRGGTQDGHVGEVGGHLATVAVTPTVSTTPAYGTADCVGGVMTVASVARANGKTGYVTYVEVISKTTIASTIDVFIFNANPTASTTTDNAMFVLNSADIGKLCGVAQIDVWVAAGGAVVGVCECRVPLHGQTGSDFYAVAVVRGTETLATTSDIIVKFTSDNN